MLNAIKQRVKDERGFTLIELMVVVLIIAILIAIAIPTFLGARERAQDRAAQSSLRNALTAAKTIFTDNEDYGDADTAALSTAEPSLTFVVSGSVSDDPNEISVKPGFDNGGTADDKAWYAVAASESGKCFGISDDVGSGGPGTEYALEDDASVTCSADGFTPTVTWTTAGW